jgi:hypothetical protein
MNNESPHFTFGMLFPCACSFGWCLHFFTLFQIFICTTCFDIIGHLQAYKLVSHCRSFFIRQLLLPRVLRFVLCSHARVMSSRFLLLELSLVPVSVIDVFVFLSPIHAASWSAFVIIYYYNDEIKTGQINWAKHVAAMGEMLTDSLSESLKNKR